MIHAQDNYAPILKVKRGENRALRELDASIKHRVMPLLEIVELTDKTKTFNQHLDTAFKDLAASVESYSRCLLDCRELQASHPQASEAIFLKAQWQNIVFTPVTGISRSNDDIFAAMKHREHGLALRLTREEFENGDFPVKLQSFMSKYGLASEEIDLVTISKRWSVFNTSGNL